MVGPINNETTEMALDALCDHFKVSRTPDSTVDDTGKELGRTLRHLLEPHFDISEHRSAIIKSITLNEEHDEVMALVNQAKASGDATPVLQLAWKHDHQRPVPAGANHSASSAQELKWVLSPNFRPEPGSPPHHRLSRVIDALIAYAAANCKLYCNMLQYARGQQLYDWNGDPAGHYQKRDAVVEWAEELLSQSQIGNLISDFYEEFEDRCRVGYQKQWPCSTPAR